VDFPTLAAPILYFVSFGAMAALLLSAVGVTIWLIVKLLRKAVRLFHTKPLEKSRVQQPSRLVGARMDSSLTGTIGRGRR
jgi:hypothetical protein